MVATATHSVPTPDESLPHLLSYRALIYPVKHTDYLEVQKGVNKECALNRVDVHC